MTHTVDGRAIAIRVPTREDIPALAAFAAAMPAHDLLFLARDIRQPRVLEAWLDNQEAGQIASFIAVDGGTIVATVAAISDRLSWSAHVWDLRLLVGPDARNKGLGRALLDRAVAAAVAAGATKLTARMTPDQTGAITLFEESGFRAEALLRDQLRDAEGALHDLAVLAMEPAREASRREAFGD
ncbi:MAG: N-acetyltransferase family protein [Novosphingobium sp.]